MATLNVFDFTTLNGYYKDARNDFRWHKAGAEENAYAAEGANSKSILVFGRVTYTIMASYWPTPMAAQNSAEVAKGMNASEKIVFSNTLKKADWQNTTLIKGDAVEEMKKLKKTLQDPMTILGSGNLVSQIADANLIDTYQIMIDPVLFGGGTSLFGNMKNKLELKLTGTRAFKSGCVLLSYEAIK